MRFFYGLPLAMLRGGLIGILGVLFIGIASLSALDVAEQELQQGRPVDFLNYRGQYTRIVPPEEFRQTGIGLARLATAPNTRFTSRNQYTIIRAIDAADTKGFDADIFMLEAASDIVDIRGIRALLSGYLEGQYGYNARNAYTLATFATYYNALYRGRMDYFRGQYKRAVINYLTPARTGIALDYRAWPGRTQIVVPLSDILGSGKSDLDIDQFTGEDVTSTLQQRPDMGIDERKDILDIKEEALEKKQEEVDKGKEQLEADKQKLEESAQEVKAKEDALEQKKDDLKNETDPGKQAEIKEEIAKDEKGLEELKSELRQNEDAIKQQETKIDQAQEILDQKKEELVKEAEQIKKDESTLLEQKLPENVKEELQQQKSDLEQQKSELDAKAEELRKIEEELKKGEMDRNILDGGLYYLKVIEPLNDGHYKSEMVLINPSTRKVVLTSPYKSICGSRYDVFSGGVVVIGYDGTHTGGHYLVLLDTKTLEVTARGKVLIYWKSFIEVKQDSAYAVIQDGGGYYLGRFNAKLEQEARSKERIDRDSFITFFGQYIYVNSPDKTIYVFNVADLTLVDTIRP